MLVLKKSKPAASPKRALFLKSMPKGAVDTGPVYMLTDEMASRYENDPSVLAALLAELKSRKVDNMEGNVEIRHPKGYSLGMWNGAMSTLDPNYSPPDIKGASMAKSMVNVKASVRKNGAAVKPHVRTHKDGTGKPPSFHVTREEDGDQYIDSSHTHFGAAKKRMMDVHKEDEHASPMVTSMPHGIMAFPHVETGKATTTPAYKRAAAAAHPDHQDHWADSDQD
jgi:hypothetical protein